MKNVGSLSNSVTYLQVSLCHGESQVLAHKGKHTCRIESFYIEII